MHAGRKIALLCIDPWTEPAAFHPFNYAIRRVQAALLAAAIEGVEIHLVEATSEDADTLLARLEAIDPDVVGASAYVWSFAMFLDIAERLKRRRPDVTVILGGPSARPAMFALAPYRERRFAVDALVLGEGEHVFAQIVALAARDAGALASVPGLALPSREGWRRTAEAAPIEDPSTLPSPYVMGLVPSTYSAHLESFRGCPLRCSFCQWGEAEGNNRTFSREYLVRELTAIRELGLPQAVLVDAGLNLNLRAFRNLAAAEREVRVLRDIGLHFEVYPSHLTGEHLDFLSEIRLYSIGLGLQSYDKEVLRRLQRPFEEDRFETVARELSTLGGEVNIEIIMGLPGDTPAAFKRTLERARALPCNVRAYHCMVLPDALMTRAPDWADMEFDPNTLLMRRCAGWSERDLAETGAELALACEDAGGWSQGTFWYFPREGRRGFSGPRSEALVAATERATPEVGAGSNVQVLSAASVAKISAVVAAATGGHWAIDGVERRDGMVVLETRSPGGPFEIELAPAREGAPAYRVVGDVAVSYRKLDGPLSRDALETLDRLSARVSGLFRQLVHADAAPLPRAPASLPVVR